MRTNFCLSDRGRVPLIPQKGGQLMWIVGGREAGLVGADDSERFVSGEMREGFFEGAREMELRSF